MRAVVLVAAALAAAGCVAASEPVELDLCAPGELGPDERAAMDGAHTWQVLVLGLRGDDVVFERALSGNGSASGPLLELSEAAPPGQAIRLLVLGYDTAGSASLLVALAGSEPLVLVGGERVCLCVAPPGAYAQACYGRSCAYEPSTGCRF